MAAQWILFRVMIVAISAILIRGTVLSDLDHHFLNNSSTSDHLNAWLDEASSPSDHSQFLRPSSDFVPSVDGLFTRHQSPILINHLPQRNPHFVDLEAHQRRIASHYSPDYRSSPYQQEPMQAMHSVPNYDVTLLKKHDYAGGNNFGGWDNMYQGGGSGGFNLGGLGQVGQVVKKGKEAKALFVLMAPLILLAVFGPFLATQAMIPWFANGGLSSVSTIATGKRRKRSPYNPELEKRLQLFLEVQDFIAKSGSREFAEEMGEAFLQCQKYTERKNKCLERVACEYTDDSSSLDPAERRIAKMVLQNVMTNTMVPASIKGRLSKGSMFGKNYRGRCKNNYWCEAIDNPKINQ